MMCQSNARCDEGQHRAKQDRRDIGCAGTGGRPGAGGYASGRGGQATGPSLTTTVVQSAYVTVPPGTTAQAQAICPQGTQLTGGGYTGPGNPGLDITQNQPDQPGT